MAGSRTARQRESREPVLLGERTAEFLQEWHCQTPYAGKGILRHTDAGLTMNIYTHAQDPAKRAALERFESRLVQ
ncbi:MAG: hypothetical protein WBQ72_12490 [Terriglobales bacterium]|jgi:hypothetical protein